MNRRILWCLLAILIWPKPALAQLPGNATLVLFPSTPSGNCNSRQLALDQSNGSLYTCINAAATNQGTWQIVAGGGGGGGGWNPPTNTPGNTVFGNNAIGTGSPSFFTPGGDVSFSAGNFSVNSLHFGPNALALTNTGIATGNCLQVSGSSIIGGACGTGGGGAVTSVFGRTGAIAALAADYASFYPAINNAALTGVPTAPTAAVGTNTTQLATTAFVIANAGTGGGGGGVNAGTVNALAKYNTTTTVASSLASDDGTTFNYTGAGGLVAPKFTITQGPFELTSITGSLPNTPGTGRNGLVSGPDGWYFSNNNGAYQLIGTGGGGGGVTSFNSRTGAIVPQASDYSAFFAPIGSVGGGLTGTGNNNVIPKFTAATNLGSSALTDDGTALTYSGTGGINTITPVVGENSTVVPTTQWVRGFAAPLVSPALSGTPTVATNPPVGDSSQRIATTSWVASQLGGGGVPIPISHGGQPPRCDASNVNANLTWTMTGLTINDGDTVLVVVSATAGANITATVTDNASPVNVYTMLVEKPTSTPSIRIFGTAAGAARAATTITVTNSQNARMVTCVATYAGVTAISPSTFYQAPASGPVTVSLAASNVGDVLFSSISQAVINNTLNITTGTLLAQGSNNATSGVTIGLCENYAIAVGSVTCVGQFSAGSNFGLGVLLIGGAVTPGVSAYPKVVAYHKANITVTTTATTDVAFMTCSATNCPPGYYRVTWDFLSLGSGCTNGTVIVNIDYYDEYDLNTAYHTGIGSASAVGPGRNHVFWNRLQTVAKLFNSTTGINFTTTTTPCSFGTATAQQTVSVERLQ